MGEWRLFDETAPLENLDDSHRYIVIESEKQLRTELDFWRCQKPSAICLVSPADEQLKIGIGGPYCGIRWTKPPIRENLKMPIADPRVVDQGIEFRWQGQEMGFRSQHILTVDEAVPVILFFFTNHRLADWVKWWCFASVGTGICLPGS